MESQSLLNEVKYSNECDVSQLVGDVHGSQSLLNEVKYSNLNICGAFGSAFLKVAIPFKWGQVFQQIDNIDMYNLKIDVAIPFKWGQVFQLNYLLRGITVTI